MPVCLLRKRAAVKHAAVQSVVPCLGRRRGYSKGEHRRTHTGTVNFDPSEIRLEETADEGSCSKAPR